MTPIEIEDVAVEPEPMHALIELMFFAYRDFVEDADRMLAGDGFGRAHHRVLYFASRRPGLTVAELLDILKITKQSLNRVLKDLLDRGFVTNRLGEADRRQRLLFATLRGDALIQAIAAIQSARFSRAFASLGDGAEGQAAAFLAAMRDGTGAHLHPKSENADMRQVNIHDAKTQLSRLVDEAANGVPFIIAKAGKPMVKVVPVDQPEPLSRIGFLEGQIEIPDDFDRMRDAEIAKVFGFDP